MAVSRLALLYGGVYLGTAVLAAGLSYWAETRAELRSRHWFAALMLALAVWAVVSAMGVFASSRAVHAVLTPAWVVIAVTVGLLWLVFVVDYTNDDPRESRTVGLFALAYVGLLAVAVTMPFHDLYYGWVEFRTEPFPHVETGFGPGRVAALTYIFLSATVGLRRVWNLFVNTRYQSRRQALVLFVGAVVGVAPSLLSMHGLMPVPTHNHTVVGVAAFVFAITYTVHRHSLVDLSPVGRDIAVGEMADPLFVLDARGRLVDYNDAARQVASDLGTDAIGTSLSAAVPQLEGVTGTADPPSELSLSGDDRQHHYSVRVSTVDSGGSPQGYVVLLRDITALRDRERELEAAKRRLEQSNERLEEFAGVVSHDLRNPLNVARLRLDLARDEADSEHLDEVAQAHERMEELIDDLLTLARTGQDIDTRQEVSLAEFASGCWQTVATDDATLVVDTETRVQADPDRLRQLLENLLRNAIQHGDPDVTITVGELPDGFYVADDGAGIPEAEREQVLDHGYTTDDDGTGLGLAIVRNIADAHGWTVAVTESGDGGARFEFTGVEIAREADPA